jgi:hypothetical protein
MFSMVNLAGLLIRLPILHFLEPPLLRAFGAVSGLGAISAEFAARNSTLAVAVAIVMLWNFFVNRHWTYNDIDSPERS